MQGPVETLSAVASKLETALTDSVWKKIIF